MKKKFGLLLVMLVVAVLAGCGVESKYTVDKKDNISLEQKIYFTEEEYETLYADADTATLEESGYVGKKTVDGKKYHLFVVKEDNSDISDLGEGAVLNATEFEYTATPQEASSDTTINDEDAQKIAEQLQEMFTFCDFTITFPYEIVATNGTLSSDKKTVRFEGLGKNANDTTIYAYTSKSEKGKDTTKPVIFGVKNGKTYKKAVKVTFKDEKSGIKKATLNGKEIKSGKKISKKGSYTLKVTDRAGNTKTIKFKIK